MGIHVEDADKAKTLKAGARGRGESWSFLLLAGNCEPSAYGWDRVAVSRQFRQQCRRFALSPSDWRYLPKLRLVLRPYFRLHGAELLTYRESADFQYNSATSSHGGPNVPERAFLQDAHSALKCILQNTNGRHTR